jgi:S1-C subfamily serine protease
MSERRYTAWQMLGFAAVILAIAGGACLAGLVVGHQWGLASARSARMFSFGVPSIIAPEPPNRSLPSGQPYLGVTYETLTASLAGQHGLAVSAGAWVRRVEPGSPAEVAGLQPGDVIVAVDGVRLGAGQDLRAQILSRAPGDEIVLTVARGDQTLSLTATLGAAPGG